ncbi:hypothetical protein [Pseudomonas sp. LRF_L74]|uniref:hypothetical protein n=1 Tax=Pseudomonas sp. LRF_L74 TaxID=3369422 RepID=UPI003F5FCBDE
MSVIHQRSAAVRDTFEAIKALQPGSTPTEPLVERLRALVGGLAARRELFPAHSFPVKPGSPGGGMYRLAEDPDYGYAIYLSVGVTGRVNHPHRHRSWALIAGVAGRERNRLYRRVDAGEEEGLVRLEQFDDLYVEAGSGLFLPVGEYHNIEVVGSVPALHLHAYEIGRDAPGNPYARPHRLAVQFLDGHEALLDAPPPPPERRLFVPRVDAAQLAEALTAGPLTVIVIDDAEPGPLAAQASLRLDDWEAGLERLPPARAGEPLIIVAADPDVAEIAAIRLARLGFSHLHHYQSPAHVPA